MTASVVLVLSHLRESQAGLSLSQELQCGSGDGQSDGEAL